jgi:hypothetical protein
MNIQNSIKLELTQKEFYALGTVAEIFDKISNALPEDSDLVVEMTGECIVKNDITILQSLIHILEWHQHFIIDKHSAIFEDALKDCDAKDSNQGLVEWLIDNLKEQYPNEQVHAIFGGAYHLAGEFALNKVDFNKLAMYAAQAGEAAHFFGWHDGTLGAMNTFCTLLSIDPALVETSLGVRFEELANFINNGTKVSNYIYELRCE